MLVDGAFRCLQNAIHHGFTYADHVRTDSDLAPLHSDPRFAAIVAEAGRRVTASQKQK
jgi:hypothetical protein